MGNGVAWGVLVMRQLICLLLVVQRLQAHNDKSVRNLCKSDIDIMAEDAVRIEPVAQSHVEILLAKRNFRNRDKVEFAFRTRATDGILMYTYNKHKSSELLGLRLSGGRLQVNIHCKHASVDVIHSYPYPLNDDRWHQVSIILRRRPRFEVDGIKHEKVFLAECTRWTSFVFGGVSPNHNDTVQKRLEYGPHFEGCIGMVKLPTAMRAPPLYRAISNCPRY